MAFFFGDDYVTQISTIVFDPSGGQFGPEVTGFNYSEFFGVGEDELVGDTFSFGGPVVVDVPFVGDTEIFRARIFGEIGAQFGLQVTSTLDPGSIDAIIPYETVVAFPDFDVATISDGDIVDLFFGATFDPEEETISATIRTYWTNFAKSMDPNQGAPVSTEWPLYDAQRRPYLFLNEPSTQEEDPFAADTAFWYSIGFNLNTFPPQ